MERRSVQVTFEMETKRTTVSIHKLVRKAFPAATTIQTNVVDATKPEAVKRKAAKRKVARRG